MKQYADMTPEERFAELAQLAEVFFETERWKSAFCRRYGLTPQALTKWTNNGAPLWSVQAMADAIEAKRLGEIRELIGPV